jgi:NAD+ synthase
VTALLPVVAAHHDEPSLAINPKLAARWLEAFLRDELVVRRGIGKAILGLSGGIDSALVAYLCARALGPENVYAIRMPYKTSAASSLSDARRNALPVGTGNKTERLMGYFTWHADDTPPVNPIGDLFKTQVWALARHLGVPTEVVDKPPSADLEANQTDEGDLGITYAKADRILNLILLGYKDDAIVARGLDPAEVKLVRRRVDSTHWKRHLPTTALVSGTAINEFYLRPVDF